jgi:hypothetical protein
LTLDHHLRRDAGMVGAGLPQHVAAAHPLEAAQYILQRVVECVAHMQRAGDIRRRDDDREGFCIAHVGTAGAERARVFPKFRHAAFDIRRLVIFFDHIRNKYR